jgi:hypothetical protein
LCLTFHTFSIFIHCICMFVAHQIGHYPPIFKINMLVKLELQERVSKLYFCTKWSRGLFLLLSQTITWKKHDPRDLLLLKQIENYHATNIVEKQVKNNTKCFDIPSSKTLKLSNSFLVKTLIDWNQLEDSVVCATSVESFKSALTNRQ